MTSNSKTLLREIRNFLDGLCIGNRVADNQARELIIRLNTAIADTSDGPQWAIAYHANSHSPRAVKWYRVSRVVYVDGRWFELYWHPDDSLRSKNYYTTRRAAVAAALNPLPGLFRNPESPHAVSEMIRVA